MVGHYEMLFCKKTSLIYRTSDIPCQAFFIRRMGWLEILEETMYMKFMMDHFHKIVLADYVNKIYNPIKEY